MVDTKKKTRPVGAGTVAKALLAGALAVFTAWCTEVPGHIFGLQQGSWGHAAVSLPLGMLAVYLMWKGWSLLITPPAPAPATQENSGPAVALGKTAVPQPSSTPSYISLEDLRSILADMHRGLDDAPDFAYKETNAERACLHDLESRVVAKINAVTEACKDPW